LKSDIFDGVPHYKKQAQLPIRLAVVVVRFTRPTIASGEERKTGVVEVRAHIVH
jgi:hypothetical protein